MKRIFLIIAVYFSLVFCKKDIILKKVEICEANANYDSPMYAHFYTKKGVQYISGNITINEPWGEKTLTTFSIYIMRNGKYTKLSENKFNFCYATKTILGPFIDDVYKSAQILPGSCPIPKGRYTIKDYPLDFRTMFLKETLPLGMVKFKGENRSTRTNKMLLCAFVEVEVVNKK